ncbi:MAG: YicC family protein [Proteobacteria bacterium]|nr:YicC family protein [Pseudomonadota bacterium]
MTLRSMTGFGRGVAGVGGSEMLAEARCVNSRHLGVRSRLPRELAGLESRVRQLAGRFFARGQVEIGLRLPQAQERGTGVEVDVGAALEYARAAEELAGDLGLEPALDLSVLLSLPGVARTAEAEAGPKPDEWEEAALQAVEAAFRAAEQMRTREGETLTKDLRGMLDGVVERIARIEARAEAVRDAQRERLHKRLAALAPEIEVDPARLEQEVLLQVERMDVSEEIVRLRSHCEQFGEVLEGGSPAGRKLEFLLQEIGRELNTVGSKAADAALAREVVELKAELEKVREQVLNVE